MRATTSASQASDRCRCGGSFDQRVDNRRAAATFVRACEEVVLAAERERADGSLGGVIRNFETPVVDVARQRANSDEGARL